MRHSLGLSTPNKVSKVPSDGTNLATKLKLTKGTDGTNHHSLW
jgi:hypothetical protein